MAKRVLIVYATGGMGHVTAARAIQQAFERQYPDVEVHNVDIIDYASSVYKKVFVNGYNFVSARQPALWGWLYRKFNQRSRQKLPTALSQLAIEGKFIPFVQQLAPDFVISTHPLPMRLISHSKRTDVIDISSSMVVTDFGCHSFWVDDDVNYYFVATNDVARCLQTYTVKPAQLRVTGIPIELRFSEAVNVAAVRRRLGLQSGQPTVLIVGGQFTYAALERMIRGVRERVHQCQFIIVAGRDAVLNQALASSPLKSEPGIVTFGFTDTMHELMSVADLIFSKAGGLTVSECMAKGLPMIIQNVIPGQEDDNVQFLVGKGAALHPTTPAAIIETVSEVLNNPDRLQAMKKAALAIGKPSAAKDLADFVYQLIKKTTPAGSKKAPKGRSTTR